MKILKKPKLLPTGCQRCGCVYLPKMKNLRVCRATKIRDEVHCPKCFTANKAVFDIAKPVVESEKDNEQ